MSPADATAPLANGLLGHVAAFAATVAAGVIVSLVTLWLADRQRTRQDSQADACRRAVVLAAIGRELRWNRVATRGTLQASNAHITVGALTTVAFERHADELATISPQSIENVYVYKHYSLVATAREGIRALGPPGAFGDEHHRKAWIALCSQASVAVSNSATEALDSLGLPVRD